MRLIIIIIFYQKKNLFQKREWSFMTLDRIKRGQAFKIVSIPNETVRAQAIRFGINEGEEVYCEEVVPAGPVVIRKNRQMLALGRELARQIKIKPGK